MGSYDYEFTPEMGEISGMGGSYEAGCRAMLKAGCRWLEAHPDADPHFHGYQNVYGIIEEDNDDAKALTDAILDAPFTDPETGQPTTVKAYGATGAMHQAVVTACLFIRKAGWDEYVRQMSEPDEVT